ncbi:hypothetical protein L7F22_029982 [Adiantum nelumboides]|nr:hypothetical protein [Adiantum nelumboides]
MSAVIAKFIHPLKKPASMEDSSCDGEPPFSFYPPLYVTQTVEPTRPSSPSPSSPTSSPYVVNFKRRGPLQRAPMQNHADEGGGLKAEKSVVDNGTLSSSAEMEAMDEAGPCHEFSSPGCTASMGTCCDATTIKCELEMAEDDQYPRETGLEPRISNLSEVKKPRLTLSKSGTGLNRDQFISPRGSAYEEFYDAPESPLDDSTSEEEASSSSLTLSRLGRTPEELLRCLQEEIVRRRRAEEALVLLQQGWHEAAQKCASMGISLTASEDLLDNRSIANLHGGYEPFARRLYVARVVAGAVASAAVRAAKDEELDGIIANKNWEISRLRDKLEYVELVNREMSQRNQEVTEITQRRKRQRKRRQKWVIGCFCSALCLGTAGLLCYKLIPWDQTGTWTKPLESSAQD